MLAEKSPVAALADVVLMGAAVCAQGMKPYIASGDGDDRIVRELTVFQELLCFFMHLVNRAAYAAYGERAGRRLQDELAPRVILAYIESMFPHWSEDLKDGIRRDMFERLNEVEFHYAECRGLIDQTDPTTGVGLFSRLCQSVAELSGNPSSAEVLSAAMLLIVPTYNTMDLESHVARAVAFLGG